MAFKIATSPHMGQKLQTSTVMQRVLWCAVPGLIAQCVFFGWGTLIQLALAIIVCVSAEAAVMKLRGRSVSRALSDYSAVVTALLLAVSIPPLAPWWLIVIGSLFAILLVKQAYGGLGNNIFNPAMAAYVLLLISFPVQMTSWLAPSTIAPHVPDFWSSLQAIWFQGDIHAYRVGIDGVTMATPLDALKTDLSMGLTVTESLSKPIFADGAGVGWFWVNAMYLLGGLILLKLNIIRWHLPVAFLASLLVFSSIGYLMGPDTHGTPWYHLFSGATMLAAFFIITDPVTAATSPKGRIIFGILIGLLVYLIRSFGGYPDAVAFAVLLANLCAPFIDYYVRPRTYGHRSGH
ncbi:electron transport complex subunit RsxD [Shewanella sp. NIFS-20-20]|uniref:electron transport complex subunit RsxD n=1 Tax=Shewanella sp. NIFS-20-20 TaxID=2853806 RepID=UPI001C479B5D|nr:electron transport complex subunit RsxD [Shewanella sp. NIFS-20-20]MBV7317448.1 electron transport complex subunit RsxD [Shewanella sp. NIFS-20-20]